LTKGACPTGAALRPCSTEKGGSCRRYWEGRKRRHRRATPGAPICSEEGGKIPHSKWPILGRRSSFNLLTRLKKSTQLSRPLNRRRKGKKITSRGGKKESLTPSSAYSQKRGISLLGNTLAFCGLFKKKKKLFPYSRGGGRDLFQPSGTLCRDQKGEVIFAHCSWRGDLRWGDISWPPIFPLLHGKKEGEKAQATKKGPLIGESPDETGYGLYFTKKTHQGL